jgi:hypothetical protein
MTKPPTSAALTSLAAAALVLGCSSSSQQRADLTFEPVIQSPAWAEDRGPVVQIDEAHSNFHTVDGRYAPFAKLLRRDGYVVRGLAAPATAASLAGGDLYVVANAIAASDEKGWKLPIEPAFSPAEIEAIVEWVEGGGALLLIADHMPFPGAVEDLAAAFGVLFNNGFLYDATNASALEFCRDSGLADHPITDGRGADERVECVRTFTGQAFRTGAGAAPLLTVPAGSRLKLPIEAWEFEPSTPSIPAGGMLQGAVLRHGRGRVAVFGEAAMFSAQESLSKDGRRLMGMNRPDATENSRFLLNVVHWLSGLLPAETT